MSPAFRKEYAVAMYEMTQDFSLKNPVYSWRVDKGYEVKIFAFNINDLSVVSVVKESTRAANTNVVHICK